MTSYELALLVLMALVLCASVYDIIKVRNRLRNLEASEKWLSAALRTQAEVHQRVLDQHSREIQKLNETHEKFAKRVQYYMNQTPSYGRLASQVDRLMKADATRALYEEKALAKSFEGELPPGTEEPF